MSTRGFLTQCDSGEQLDPYLNTLPCPATARLSKPQRWRCADCEALYGPIVEEPDDLP